MRGRKPIPTAMKIAAGNPGKRPLNTNEPKPRKKIPPCPDFLDEEGRRQWKRTAKLLANSRIITELDGAALAAYCQAWSRWIWAEKHLQKYGPVILSPDKKYPMHSPYLSIANKSMEQVLRFLTEFGMTPSSRSRISAIDEDFGHADDPNSIENFQKMTFDVDPPLMRCAWTELQEAKTKNNSENNPA